MSAGRQGSSAAGRRSLVVGRHLHPPGLHNGNGVFGCRRAVRVAFCSGCSMHVDRRHLLLMAYRKCGVATTPDIKAEQGTRGKENAACKRGMAGDQGIF